METLINAGQLLYIDLFSKFSDWITSELPITEEPPLTWKEVPKKAEVFSVFSEENLEKLFDKIEAFSQTKGKTWVFIDNLNMFVNSFESSKMSMSFINSFLELLKMKNKNFNLLILGTIDDENPMNLKLIQLLELSANIVIEIQQNPSGFSQDIDGNVMFF